MLGYHVSKPKPLIDFIKGKHVCVCMYIYNTRDECGLLGRSPIAQ